MFSRRKFLGTVAAGIAAPAFAEPLARKRLAVVTTEWRERSHAWHMAERFLGGYPIKGKWHRPPIDVVSAYVDQFPKNDLSRGRAKESGFTIYKSVAEALRNGTDKLAVDAVLIIGEHGNYPDNEFGQKKYPRYEFFKQCVEVFQKDGKVVPIFNDKHLSWKWEWAKEMVNLSRTMKFPFLAGSSLPVTWRMPAIDMPYGAELDEVMCVAMGGVDSYDFHALEVIQCMAERRKGGETGVKSLQALRGDSVWKAMEAGDWSAKLFDACLARSQTLAQPPTYSHRMPTLAQMKAMVKSPVCYRFEYADGLKATMLLLNGLVGDFTFSAKLKGKDEPLSTLFYLPPNPNVTYSASLMSKAEEMFLTGVAPYPVERTLLTAGLVEAGMQSLAKDQKRLETPHLAVKYTAPKESLFARE
ncbi:MAG: hypothetical protein KF873_02765 [Gemmataceae bacterium]|nr:hypothetical protein [Gemmataceae bacterium]